MAQSYITYVSDGDTRLYGIPFSFLKKEHIKVYIDNEPYTEFIWSTDSTLEFATAPAKDAVVRIQRETPYDSGMVKFTTSNILDPDNLNLTVDQLLFSMQEALDKLTTTIALANDNKYDAQNKVIKNVADPVDPTDAVNKRYIQPAVDQAMASATAAKTSEINAKASENRAITAETNAKNSEIKAATSATNAEACEMAAFEFKQAAELSATKAKASEDKAKVSETNAKAAETNAKAAETNAAASAAAAAISENNVLLYSTNAANSAAAAANSATAAATSATQAATSAYSAVASAEQAEKWANEAIGVEVEAGKYSAKHWANEARRIANGELIYPVGSIYINASVSTNPATLLGFGTWERFGQGRVLVGVDESQAEFAGVRRTGGNKTHTLTEAEMPSHRHGVPHTYQQYQSDSDSKLSGGGRGTADARTTNSYYTGGNQPHNNLQPYVTVYMWRRIA